MAGFSNRFGSKRINFGTCQNDTGQVGPTTNIFFLFSHILSLINSYCFTYDKDYEFDNLTSDIKLYRY